MGQFFSNLRFSLAILYIIEVIIFIAILFLWWHVISRFIYVVCYGSSRKIKQKLKEISDPRIFSHQLWLEGKEEEYRALKKQIRAQKNEASGWGLLLAVLIPLFLFPKEIFALILLDLL